MSKKFISHIFCWTVLFIPFLVCGQASNDTIQNYYHTITKSGSVIYSVCKDVNGVFFFATTNGVLIYTGKSFDKVTIEGNLEGRIVEYDPYSKRIFVGGDSEFGYLTPDSTRGYRYTSLSKDILEAYPFREVWQILPKDSLIYFQTYEGIYKWDYSTIEFIEIPDSYIFDGDSVIIISQFEGNLGVLENNQLKPIYDQGYFKEEAVFQILPQDNQNIILLVTSSFGAYLLDPIKKIVEPYNTPVNEFFKKYYFYQAIKLNRDIYVAGTWEGGIVFFDINTGNILKHLDEESGLISNAIYDLEKDDLGNLWTVGELGISRIDLTTMLPGYIPDLSLPHTLVHSVSINVDSLLNPIVFKEPVFNFEIDRISFEFATPGVDYFGDHQYSYLLEGHDKEWSPWTSSNAASYSELENGRYTFHVKSKINDTIESTPGVFAFQIQKPWYYWIEINFKYLLTGFLIAAAIFFGLTYRLRRSKAILENKVDARTRELALQKDELKKANDNLTELNQELDNFVYRSSHDLVAPIKSVKGLLNILKLARNDNERNEYIEMMDARLIKLEKFISEINNYTKNEKKEIELSEFNLRELVVSTWEELSYYRDADKINFQINIDGSLNLCSDFERWEMIMSNLITNSIKYHNIQKKNPYIRISSKQQNGLLNISIEDNGQGIRQEHMEKICDMFFRANESSEGSGLGLYLVRKTLEKLKGELHISSEFGEGTLINITFPSN